MSDTSEAGPLPASEADLAASEADLAVKMAACRAAAVRWSNLSLSERVRGLERFADRLLVRGEDLVAAVQADTGKPEVEAWLHEVLPIHDLRAYWTGSVAQSLVTRQFSLDALQYPGKEARVYRVPVGVVALITPWNFPLAIPLRTLFPALLAGNGVVFKPSEFARQSAKLVAAIAFEVLGPDLVQLVVGGAEQGAQVIRGGVDAVVFTGGTAGGRAVAQLAATTLLPCSLELGGSDAALVLEDAPIERAVAGVTWAAMANAGQNCAAIERVYVCESIADDFIARLREAIGQLRFGSEQGPLVTEAQRVVLEQELEHARAVGGQVVTSADGKAASVEPVPAGCFVPTLVIASAKERPQGELFGPVVYVSAVRDQDEAVACANASDFGLTASVWTKNLERGRDLAQRLEAGVVVVNNHGFTGAVPSLPWTGVGATGPGVTNSEFALGFLTRPMTVVTDAGRGARELWWFPYTGGLLDLARAMHELRRPRQAPWKRARALLRLVSAMIRRWRP